MTDSPTPERVTLQLKDLGLLKDEPAKEAVPTDAMEILAPTEVDELTPKEAKAVDKGWDKDSGISADEFLRTEPLYNELRAMKKQLEEVTKFNDEQRTLGYRQALRDLQEQKRHAITTGNIEAVDAVEKRIETLKSPTPTLDAFQVKFKETHQHWFDSPSADFLDARAYLQKRDADLIMLAQNGKITRQQHLEMLTNELHEKFPQTLGNRRPVVKSKVDTDDTPRKTTTAATKNAVKFSELSAEQQAFATHLAATGAMTIDAYLSELASDAMTRGTYGYKAKTKR